MSAKCVCVCSDDYDSPEVYHEGFPIAKKSHICCECDREIKPGERYHKFTGLWKGEWMTFRTCLPCYRIREEYCNTGYIFGELRNELWDCFGFDYVTGEEAEDDVS